MEVKKQIVLLERAIKEKLQKRVHVGLKDISIMNFPPMYHTELAYICYPFMVIVLSKVYCHMKLNLTPFMFILLHTIYEIYRQINHYLSRPHQSIFNRIIRELQKGIPIVHCLVILI